MAAAVECAAFDRGEAGTVQEPRKRVEIVAEFVGPEVARGDACTCIRKDLCERRGILCGVGPEFLAALEKGPVMAAVSGNAGANVRHDEPQDAVAAQHPANVGEQGLGVFYIKMLEEM